jgi:hypothetical protein
MDKELAIFGKPWTLVGFSCFGGSLAPTDSMS